jgi:hypothetical protein
MNVFWHNDGISLRPENQKEHDALALLWSNLTVGRPPHLRPRLPSEGLCLGVSDHQGACLPSHVLGELGNQQSIVVVDTAGQVLPDGVGGGHARNEPLGAQDFPASG